MRSERLAGMHDLICGVRAEANHECLGILDDREKRPTPDILTACAVVGNTSQGKSPPDKRVLSRALFKSDLGRCGCGAPFALSAVV